MNRPLSLDRMLTALRENRQGRQSGVYSICSANPHVLRAGFLQAKKNDTGVLIESTSAQVNQDGGYTGMTPATWVEFVHKLADEVGFSHDEIVLGADHHGPNVWTQLPAHEAMEKSKRLIADSVASGARKIHLDFSMHCADDDKIAPLHVWEGTVAERAAAGCAAAEAAWKALGSPKPAPVYVFGTEVPPPGGAKDVEESVHVTNADDVTRTIEVTEAAFLRYGLSEAWSRAVAVVVQPGVEFGDRTVLDFRTENALALGKCIMGHEGLVFEAHSTDYQTDDGLAGLVQAHFAFLKVGPALTFAMREALWSLLHIEEELYKNGSSDRSNLRQVVLGVMHANPGNWKKHYHGTEQEIEYALEYSLSDRIRYYWPDATIQAAMATLFKNLRDKPIPLSLLSQYLPGQVAPYREGRLTLDPEALIQSHIREVLRVYARACGQLE